jgi:hypothetical protein
MKAKKEEVYKLELNKDEFSTLKDCLEVFESQGLNSKVSGKLGLAKLSSGQLITLNEINNYLEVIS